jgi:hypothetical protein
MPVIPALEDPEFEPTLGYIERPYLKIKFQRVKE